MRPRPLAVLVLAVVLCGCRRDHVEVTIEPKPDGSFVRTLRLWGADHAKPGEVWSPDEETVKAAEPHYERRLDPEDGAVRFQRSFRTVPPDLAFGEDTNHGDYTVLAARLGYVGYYRERRPGSMDLHARLAEMRAVVDLFVKVLAAMVRQELVLEEGGDRLVAFVEGDLRRDLHALATYVATVALTEPPVDIDLKRHQDRALSMAAFVVQFAEERGYLKATDLLKLVDEEAAKEFALAFVARKMGRRLDDGLREKLAFLVDDELRAAAQVRALKSLGMTWEEYEKATQPLDSGIIPVKFWNSDTALHYVLVLPRGAEEVHTNGRLDKDKGRIEWEDDLDGRPVGRVYFAVWNVPDPAWQTKHLGRVVLRGEPLMEYVLWENSLPPGQRETWLAALDRLDPRGDLKAQLSAIRLEPPPPDQEPEPEEGARLLLDALFPPKTE